MTEFRPCPSFPCLHASPTGVIRRISETKTGKPRDRVLTRVGRNHAFILDQQKWVKIEKLVEDAWGDELRPESSYPDGRVLTVAEWIAERAASSRDRGQSVDLHPRVKTSTR